MARLWSAGWGAVSIATFVKFSKLIGANPGTLTTSEWWTIGGVIVVYMGSAILAILPLLRWLERRTTTST